MNLDRFCRICGMTGATLALSNGITMCEICTRRHEKFPHVSEETRSGISGNRTCNSRTIQSGWLGQLPHKRRTQCDFDLELDSLIFPFFLLFTASRVRGWVHARTAGDRELRV